MKYPVSGAQQHVEKFRSNCQLDHFCAVGLAGSGFFDNLGLADVLGVVDFLDDDAGQPALSGLGGDASAVVSTGCRYHAGEPLGLGLMGAQGGTTSFEAARRISSLVLEENPGALSRAGDLTDGFGETVQLVQRGVANFGLGLDACDVIEAVASGGHQGVVIEDEVTVLKTVIVQGEGAPHDVAAAGHDVVI